jgi:hypothetical protein
MTRLVLDTLLRRRFPGGPRGQARSLIGVACCVGVLVFASAARADWPSASTNLAVCTMVGSQLHGATIPDGDGGMFVAWSDARFVVTDIYVQHVNPDGTLAWNPSGLAVCISSGRQDQPAIARDGAGGVVVVWRDYRSGVDGDLYAQRIDSTGQALWGFNGTKVCAASGQQSAAAILLDPPALPDPFRGVVIAWQDERDGPRIYAQHLLSSGVATWADDGIPVSSNLAAQFEPQLAEDGGAGVFVAWSQQNAFDYDIWAQHMDLNGTALWGPPGQRVCGAGGDQFGPVVVADGASGAWIGWQDDRGGSLAIYVQRFADDGLPVLAEDGASVCPSAHDQVSPAFSADGAGGLFAAWTDSRTGTDVYAQRLDPAGTPMWDAGGVSVVSGPGVHQFPAAAADGTGGVILAWEDSRSGSTDIYAQRLDAAGVPAWAVGGAVISSAGSNQYQASIASSGDSTAVVLWADLRAGNVDLYAQRVPLDTGVLARQASRLLSSSPNPATGSATFAFELKAPGRGELTIFDAAGRRIRTVTHADFSVGDHRIAWDARDDSGRRCAEGVYFARLILDHRVVATRTFAITH